MAARFNYAKIMNFGAASTDADLLLLLNNDTEVIAPDFIEEMAGYLQRPEVGIVGAKLLYYDGLVQHAGMLIGPDGTVVHVNQNVPDAQGCYLGRSVRPGNFSSVTGACQMVKRTVFEEVGGYSEEFAVGYNDADFCCKVSAAGYSVTFYAVREAVPQRVRISWARRGGSLEDAALAARARSYAREMAAVLRGRGIRSRTRTSIGTACTSRFPRRRTRAVNGRGSFSRV